MNKKLTLLLDERIISQAKIYAERHKITLSGIVEKYFKYLITKNRDMKKPKINPEIEELIGIINIPKNLDVKKEYRKARADKIFHA